MKLVFLFLITHVWTISFRKFHRVCTRAPVCICHPHCTGNQDSGSLERSQGAPCGQYGQLNCSFFLISLDRPALSFCLCFPSFSYVTFTGISVFVTGFTSALTPLYRHNYFLWLMVDAAGLEPALVEPKSTVLPLHHTSLFGADYRIWTDDRQFTKPLLYPWAKSA